MVGVVLSQKSSNVEELEILSVVTKPGILHLVFILFLSFGLSYAYLLRFSFNCTTGEELPAQVESDECTGLTLTLLDFLSLRSFQRAGETPELLPPHLPLDRRCLCLRLTVTFPTP